MAGVEALVTPSVLQWARSRARLSIEEAAARIGRPVEDITAWEAGVARPTIPQARKASEVYKRPLAVFYLPEPPQEFDTLRDFRSLPEAVPRDYSPELALLIRTACFRQEWLRERFLSEGTAKLGFIGSASLEHSARDVALDILQVLNLTPKEQRKCTNRNEALRLWINKAEAAGVFIFRQGSISLQEVRGFVLSDDFAPFIFLNSDDGQAAQLFTLAHELVHLWLNLSGVSNLVSRGRNIDRESAKIEIFCNRVAAEAVLEDQAFMQEWQEQVADVAIEDKIEKLSRTFKVSEEAVARRLLDKGIINRRRYLDLRQAYQERWDDYKQRKREKLKASKGGPSYYVTTVTRNGYAFTRTVVNAFEAGALSGRDASALLNVKVNNLRRLGKAAGIPISI